MCSSDAGVLVEHRTQQATPGAQVLWNTVTLEATGNEKGFLEALRVQNVKTKEERGIPVSGLFFAIGHEPASKFLNGQVRLLVRLRLLVVFFCERHRDGCLFGQLRSKCCM